MAENTPTHINTPTPDPTVLTQQATDRAISALNELFGTKFDNNRQATERLFELLDRMPGQMDQKVEKLNCLTAERFKGIEAHFAERDKALEAARKANAEATTKSETSVTKQIDNIQANILVTTRAIDDKIDGLRRELNLRIEGLEKSASTAVAAINVKDALLEGRDRGVDKVQQSSFAVIGVIGTIIGATIALILFFGEGAP